MEREKKALDEQVTEGLPSDLSLLLAEIEKEQVPEKLLTLAQRLQQALAEKRQGEAPQISFPKEPARDWIKQP